jgi:hypothetical protein
MDLHHESYGIPINSRVFDSNHDKVYECAIRKDFFKIKLSVPTQTGDFSAAPVTGQA